jgi:glycosyltransferase involved in cell wall biosynthesis
MNIVLLTPGTGSYHCGVCMRDNALARELIRQHHRAIILPMYLPLTLDEEAASPETPIFFGGISTWLREKISFLRRMPRWLDRALSKRWLLRLVAGKAAKTGGPEVAGMTISMLRAEKGNQAAELDELIKWLKVAFDGRKPDAIWLSTALQAGLARKLKQDLGIPVVGFLQGEDTFLDGLGHRAAEVWDLLSTRMQDADAWVAPSQYFAGLMAQRLGWDAQAQDARIRVILNGVNPADYPVDSGTPRPGIPTVGYLARFVPGKGIGLLLEAFILLKQRMPKARLRCAGSMTAGDRAYVEKLQARARAAGVDADVEWLPNITLEEKVRFLQSITVFSVPATYSEAFGQYVIEALAASAPVVLPRASAFPEIVQTTKAGVLFELGDNEAQSAKNLAVTLESLLRRPEEARMMGARGRAAVEAELSMTRLAERLVELTSSFSPSAAAR